MLEIDSRFSQKGDTIASWQAVVFFLTFITLTPRLAWAWREIGLPLPGSDLWFSPEVEPPDSAHVIVSLVFIGWGFVTAMNLVTPRAVYDKLSRIRRFIEPIRCHEAEQYIALMRDEDLKVDWSDARFTMASQRMSGRLRFGAPILLLTALYPLALACGWVVAVAGPLALISLFIDASAAGWSWNQVLHAMLAIFALLYALAVLISVVPFASQPHSRLGPEGVFTIILTVVAIFQSGVWNL